VSSLVDKVDFGRERCPATEREIDESAQNGEIPGAKCVSSRTEDIENLAAFEKDSFLRLVDDNARPK